MTLHLSAPPAPPPARIPFPLGRRRGGTIIPPVDSLLLSELWDQRRAILFWDGDDFQDGDDE